MSLFERNQSNLTNSQIFSYQQRENFKVAVRVRPPLSRQIHELGFSSIVSINPDHTQISLQQYMGAADCDVQREQDIAENPSLATYHHFTFDYVYDQNSTQAQVYQRTAKPAVHSILQGYNATILAYGQTGTGKTYTMEGFKYVSTDPQRGICPRASQEIFQYIESSQNANCTFMVRASYLQIYNQVVSDLLKNERLSLQIRQQKKKGVFVQGLSQWAVRSSADICSLMQKGQMTRATASTKMNNLSSRSHAVFIIILQQMSTMKREGLKKEVKVGKLNFVDLAGSERVRVTGATGKQLQESKKINQSLSALGNVIAALTDVRPRSHIPYRDSKLTRLLQDSLGGNCKTTMIAMISPSNQAFSESFSSVKFANRAKNIKNVPIINQDIDQKTLLRKYQVELTKLRSQLDSKNKAMIDMQRQIHSRNDQSNQVLKGEKQKLQEKIKIMNSQLLVGGKKLENTPQFITALQEKQRVFRKQYEGKLMEIQKERQLIQEDKAQIDRYKQLLLRQRDIMIALTARLNQRDQSILQLQEELDTYDKLHRETEESLEYKSERCRHLQEMLASNHLKVPLDQTPTAGNWKEPKRYPPHSTDALSLDEESYLPLQMLTAEQKIQELNSIIEKQMGQIKKLQQQQENQLENYMKTEILAGIQTIFQGVKGNKYSSGVLLEELEKVCRLLNGNKKVRERTPLKPQQIVRNPVVSGRRPLTVDEMLLLKRQQMKSRN